MTRPGFLASRSQPGTEFEAAAGGGSGSDTFGYATNTADAPAKFGKAARFAVAAGAASAAIVGAAAAVAAAVPGD